MAIGSRGGANNLIAQEKLEVLWGSRGNPREWALRRGELQDVQKIIADVRKSLDYLKKALQEVKDDIDDINAQIALIDQRLATAEQAINDLEADMTALEGRIQAAEDDLADIEQTITDIKGDLVSIGGDTAQLRIDLNALTVTVNANSTDIAHLQTDVTALQSDVSVMDTDITALQVDVNNLELDATSRFALQSNPGATPFDNGVFRAIPFFTNGEITGGITLTGNTVFTVPVAGLYQFELEVRTNGGATSMPPVGTPIVLSIDTSTTPTTPRAGFSAAEVVRALTITRLVCTERLAANATRVAYLMNQGAAAYQVASAVIKITRVSA